MIRSKADLKEYLLADKKQLGITRNFPRPFADEIWKYEIVLRKYEYWMNRKQILRDSSHHGLEALSVMGGVLVASIMTQFYKVLHHRNVVKTGIGIGPNCCGKGLSIAHIGTIQINGDALVGENLRIQEGVTVGAGSGGVPNIGNNVYLGSGCKVIGNVRIEDNCAVGANAVVTKDILEKGITVAGVPAKKISDKDSLSYVFWFNGGNPC